ncbi:MAG TPA: hypothetical protein VGN19_01220, partial [Pedococcus sp.]|nr:hypothetical protein [Pedococcus sp.]
LTIAVERAPRPRKVWAAVAVALPTLLLGAFVAILRSRVSHPLEVYSTSLDPTKFLPTLGKQLVATRPLSYTWFRHGAGIPSLSHALAPTPTALILVAALTAVTAVAMLRVPKFPRTQVAAMAVLGASLMLAAGSVTAVSAYWQHSLVLGDAYIGVFMQTLGLSLVGLAAVSLRPRPTAAWARHSTVAVAVVCGFAIGWTVVATSQQNARVVTASDPRLGSWASQPQLGFPRALTGAAFERGLLVGDPSNGTVYGNPGGPWFNSTFLSYAAHRAVRVPNQWPFWSLAPDATTRLPGCARVGPCEPASGPVYTVTVRAASYERGVVVLARAARIDQLDPQPTDASVTTEQARVFLSGYGGPSRPCARTQGAAGPLVVSPTKQRVVSTGAGWTIIDVTFAAPGIPASGIGQLSGSSCL